MLANTNEIHGSALLFCFRAILTTGLHYYEPIICPSFRRIMQQCKIQSHNNDMTCIDMTPTHDLLEIHKY